MRVTRLEPDPMKFTLRARTKYNNDELRNILPNRGITVGAHATNKGMMTSLVNELFEGEERDDLLKWIDSLTTKKTTVDKTLISVMETEGMAKEFPGQKMRVDLARAKTVVKTVEDAVQEAVAKAQAKAGAPPPLPPPAEGPGPDAGGDGLDDDDADKPAPGLPAYRTPTELRDKIPQGVGIHLWRNPLIRRACLFCFGAWHPKGEDLEKALRGAGRAELSPPPLPSARPPRRHRPPLPPLQPPLS